MSVNIVKTAGLKVNVNKTKIMVFTPRLKQENQHLLGQETKAVNYIAYLQVILRGL
jgi:hypothetical protein